MQTLVFFLILLSTFLGREQLAAAKEIKLVTLARTDSAQRVVAENFKELVEAGSAGALTVTIDFFGPGFTEAEAIEKIQTGILQMGVLTATALEAFDPITGVPSFPFLFRNEQQAATILDGPLGATILRDIETIGCKGLAFSDGGFRHLTNNIRPVHTIDDLNGLKIRVMSTPLPTATWLVLGAAPVPMPWPIYAELEQGLIEGQENPLWIIESYSFFEVQQYLTLTRHAYTALIDVASLKWWQTLSLPEQDMIQTAMTEASRLQRLGQRAREAARLTLLKSKGMIIDEQPDIDAFRSSVTKLKEMPIYREPRIQVLLTRMLEATLLPSDTAPPVEGGQKAETTIPGQDEQMQEAVHPEQPQIDAPTHKGNDALAVPEPNPLADPFDTPMQPLIGDQPGTKEQPIPPEIYTSPKQRQEEIQSTPPEQGESPRATQPIQQPTEPPLQPPGVEPLNRANGVEGSASTGPSTNEALMPIIEARMPAPTRSMQTEPADDPHGAEPTNDGSVQ